MSKKAGPDKETGKKGEPRLQFMLVQYLQDVLASFAKKLIVYLNINELNPEFIHQLNAVFQVNKGDNTVGFEVMEVEKIKKQAESIPVEIPEELILDENGDVFETGSIVTNIPEETEEIKIITKLEMPSRKLKIKISNELLVELEKMQVNFKLN